LIVVASFAGSARGAEVLTAAAVKERILGVNRQTAPFRIVDGALHKVDLVAEWKIVDAEWQQIFSRAGLKKVFRIFMRLDEARHELRAQDHYYSVEWREGKLTLGALLAGEAGGSYEKSAFKGQMWSFEKGSGYTFTETGEFGRVYTYRFKTSELKDPIKHAVAECGWKYKGVAFGKP
jgi:hypothetical protein